MFGILCKKLVADFAILFGVEIKKPKYLAIKKPYVPEPVLVLHVLAFNALIPVSAEFKPSGNMSPGEDIPSVPCRNVITTLEEDPA